MWAAKKLERRKPSTFYPSKKQTVTRYSPMKTKNALRQPSQSRRQRTMTLRAKCKHFMPIWKATSRKQARHTCAMPSKKSLRVDQIWRKISKDAWECQQNKPIDKEHKPTPAQVWLWGWTTNNNKKQNHPLSCPSPQVALSSSCHSRQRTRAKPSRWWQVDHLMVAVTSKSPQLRTLHQIRPAAKMNVQKLLGHYLDQLLNHQ